MRLCVPAFFREQGIDPFAEAEEPFAFPGIAVDGGHLSGLLADQAEQEAQALEH